METNEQVQQQPQDISSRMQQALWGDSPVTPPAQQPPASEPPVTPPAASTPATPPAATLPPATEEKVPFEWLKKEFGIEDHTVLKAEREELARLKAAPKAEEIKFENEQSKQVHELLRQGKVKDVVKILQQQEELESYTSGEVTKDNADHVIKLGMKLKYPTLSKEQIDFQFNEDYSVPSKPSQKTDELDDEYEVRVAEWKQQVSRVEMKKTIAATMAIPELQNAKTKIVLPEIEKQPAAVNQEPTQEELAAFEQTKQAFVKASEDAVNGFTGISVQIKDKDVDYNVAYVPSEEEKTVVKSLIKEFADSGFNANALFVNRWVAEDGKTIKAEQMTSDLIALFGKEKIHQKLATEAANQRMELHLKGKKNIHLENAPPAQTNQLEAKTESQKMQEQFWGN